MTTPNRFPSVCLLPLPPVPTPAEQLAPVCPASAPGRSRPGMSGILTASCGVCAPLRHAVLPRGGVLAGAAPLGHSPQTC